MEIVHGHCHSEFVAFPCCRVVRGLVEVERSFRVSLFSSSFMPQVSARLASAASNSPSLERTHLSLPWQADRDQHSEEDGYFGNNDEEEEETVTPALMRVAAVAGLGGTP